MTDLTQISTIGGSRIRLAHGARLYVENSDGDILAYVGLTQRDDLASLAKAILNAVETEALVENQQVAPTIPREFDVPALAAAIGDLQDRVADLEAAADNEIRVGDTVSVRPDDWNIASPIAVQGTTVVGKVRQVFPNSVYGPTYWVEFKSKTGNERTTALGAKRATKVGSRG